MSPHDVIAQLTGQRIVGIRRLRYEYHSDVEPEGCDLELELDSRVVLFGGAADGESLRIREGAWQDPFCEPLSEENRRYVRESGKWQRVDCSREEGYASLVGRTLIEARPLLDEFGLVSGVKLSVPGKSLWFVNAGDECHVHWSPPDGFREAK
jgi:hypothetical protein